MLKKGAAISKAGNLIQEGLRAALDIKKGGDLAAQLDALYLYMDQRITLAHLRNDPAPLHEVLGLLRELREAWQQIGASTRTASHTQHQSIAA